MDIIPIIVGGISAVASLGTGAIVILLFRRLFQNHDHLSKILDKLSAQFQDLKLVVAKNYVDDDKCKGCKTALTARIDKLDDKIELKDSAVEARINTASEKITRLETRIEALK